MSFFPTLPASTAEIIRRELLLVPGRPVLLATAASMDARRDDAAEQLGRLGPDLAAAARLARYYARPHVDAGVRRCALSVLAQKLESLERAIARFSEKTDG